MGVYNRADASILPTKPDPRPKDLMDQWLANEKAIEDAHALKSGDEDPLTRVERLDAEQDEIEYRMGEEYLKRNRQQGG